MAIWSVFLLKFRSPLSLKKMLLVVFVIATVVAAPSPTPSGPVQRLAQKAGQLFQNAVHTMSQSCSAQCPFLRQAHVKQHGCLTGVLDVNPNLPTSLQQGLFDVKAQGKSQFEGGIEQVARLFKASTVLLRFSNGKGNGFTPGYAVADDSSLDVRGFALKVFGVKGAKGHDATAETQDFIAITSETLFMEEMDNALPFFQVSEKNSSVAYYGFLALHPILAARLIKFAKSGHVTELQQTTFFTVAPLSMGSQPAKFRFSPCANNGHAAPVDTSSSNFLRSNLKTYFSVNRLAACYNVSVQTYVNPTATPVDDLTTVWNSPWREIASLSFLPQDVWSSSAKDDMCREISFHPKQTVAENAPVGWVQEVRDSVYTAEQTARHTIMGQQLGDWDSNRLHLYQQV